MGHQQKSKRDSDNKKYKYTQKSGERSPQCNNKRRYDTEEQAIGATIRSSASFNAPMRYYHCDKCGGWHLTSQIRD